MDKVWYVFVLLPTFHNQQTLGVIASHGETLCISSFGQFMSSIKGEALEGIRGLSLYWVYDCYRFPLFSNNWTNPSLHFFHSQMEHQALNRTEGLESVTFLLGGVSWSHFPLQVSRTEVLLLCNKAVWCSLLEPSPKTYQEVMK